MKKQNIRITGHGYTSARRALKLLSRGVARYVSEGEIELIQSDRTPCAPRSIGIVALPAVVPFVHQSVGDSGQSLNPMIGYNMRSKGYGSNTR